jgi:hypothetical protein
VSCLTQGENVDSPVSGSDRWGVARSLQKPRPLRNNIPGFISCHFYSFSTEILLLLAFLLLRLCLSCWCPLLKAGVPVAATNFHGHQSSTDIQLLKQAHFWKIAVTTAIWHGCRWYVDSSACMRAFYAPLRRRLSTLREVKDLGDGQSSLNDLRM